MTCDSARDAMLIADPEELRGRPSDTPLSAHLASCEKCNTIAQRLSNDLEALSVVVDARRRESHSFSRRRIAWIAAIPLAAAAVAFAVLGTREESPVAVPLAAAPRPVVSNMVSVDIARGQQATVIRTRDPKVTVVWLTNGGGL